MEKIEIKDRYDRPVIFSHKCRDNTVAITVCEAVKGGADLRDANLGGADLGGAKNIPFIPMACPSDGAFVAWKKVSGKLVKLLVPEDARRCSATTNKCRCDKAIVLDITDLDGGNPILKVINQERGNLVYKVGEIVLPDSFDEDRWNECSHGIHFFINMEEAQRY